jgi:hypothetical protein
VSEQSLRQALETLCKKKEKAAKCGTWQGGQMIMVEEIRAILKADLK